MTLKKVYSKHFPFEGYIALTFYPWEFIRKDLKDKYTPTTDRHETIHGHQQVETLWLLFFILYSFEYIIKLFVCGFNHKKAYHSISFEQEAYANEKNENYLNKRHSYAWVKYVFSISKIE